MKLSRTQTARIERLVNFDFGDDCSEEELNRLWLDELGKVEDSFELFEVAANFDWSCDIEDLKRISEHPAADRSVIHLLYALGQPGYLYRQYDRGRKMFPEEKDSRVFLKHLETVAAQGELRGVVSFDPKSFRGEDLYPDNSANPGNKLVPDFMKVAIEGDVVENPYE